MVYDVTAKDSLVYWESPAKFPEQNLQFVEDYNYWHYNIDREVNTELFDGLQLVSKHPVIESQFDEERSGWIKGDSPVEVIISLRESKYLPYEYEIRFTDDSYKTKCTKLNRIKNQENTSLGSSELLEGTFNFYVVNKSFADTVDLVVWDVNQNGEYDSWRDYILAGPVFG